MQKKQHFRTLWISDVHLGCKDCKAEQLLDFLDKNTADTLFLVGDIIDMWALSKKFRWPDTHNQLLHRLISLTHEGTRVIYLPGNHDQPAQRYDQMNVANIEIYREFIYESAKGEKILLLHGDQFDQEVCFGKLQTWMGEIGYDLLLFINRCYNHFRSKKGYPYWSLASHIKSRVSGANNAIKRYREAAINRAKQLNTSSVICGHIHHPEITKENGITYLNTGDWVENCSALAENKQGNISLIYWTQAKQTTQTTKINPAKPRNKKNIRKAA